jgi:citrate lyase synthetase
MIEVRRIERETQQEASLTCRVVRQLLKFNDADDLYKFHDDHPEIYGSKKIPMSHYSKQVNDFIKFLGNVWY